MDPDYAEMFYPEYIDLGQGRRLPAGAMTFDARKKMLLDLINGGGLSKDALEALLEQTKNIEIVEDEKDVRQRHIDNDEMAGMF
jgi:hypothetical protein